MKIYVTKSDIKRGRQCDSGKCPVAISLQRRFPKKFVSVGPRGGMIGQTPLSWPAEVTAFVLKFDCHPSNVKPFSFTINV